MDPAAAGPLPSAPPVEHGAEFNRRQSDWDPSNEFGRDRTHRVDLSFDRRHRPENLPMNQFLYIQFKVDPKATLARPTGSEMVVIELPAKHVNDWKLERPDCKLSDDEIAILITEPVAIATADRFVALTHQPLRQREIHSAKFVPERSLMMNDRDCDYQDNGIRAWFAA
jgi:hypothetical protein